MSKSVEPSQSGEVVVNRSYDWNNDRTKEIESKRLPIQATHIFPLELPVLQALGIGEAKRILDFGCGDGTWGQLLATGLGSKTPVIGADKSEMLVNVAKQKHPEAEFHVIESFQKLPGLLYVTKPDVIVARFVCQHLPMLENGEFLTTIRRNLPDARVFLIDVDDRSFSLNPPCAAFHALLKKRGEKQKALGGDREVGRKLVAYAQAAGFTNVAEKTIRIHSNDLGFENWKSIVFPVLFSDAGEEDAWLIEEVKAWGNVDHRDAFFETYAISGSAK